MEGYGEPAQPSPTIGQWFHGGFAGERSNAIAAKLASRSMPTVVPRDTPNLEAKKVAQMPGIPKGPVCPACAYDQTVRTVADHAVQMGLSQRGALAFFVVCRGGVAKDKRQAPSGNAEPGHLVTLHTSLRLERACHGRPDSPSRGRG